MHLAVNNTVPIPKTPTPVFKMVNSDAQGDRQGVSQGDVLKTTDHESGLIA